MAISNKQLTALIRSYFAHHRVKLSDIPGVCMGYTACAITAAFLGKEQLRRFYQRMIMLKTYEDRPGDLVKDIELAKEKLKFHQVTGLGTISYQEELLAELPHFFETIWLYQLPYDFYQLFGAYIGQSFYKIQEVVAPQLLTTSIKKFHRSYLAISKVETLAYLNGLERSFNKPQVMMISNGYHRFALIYHAKVDCWSVLDIERKDRAMPVLNKLEVVEALCPVGYCILRVDFLCQTIELELQASIQKLDQELTKAEAFYLEVEHVNLLYLAYKARDIEVISKLEDSGARLTLAGAVKAIDTIVELGRVEAFQWLLEQNLITAENAQRLFNIACAYGQQALCDFLLKESKLPIDINDETEKGVSALFIAAKHGQDSLCTWLVKQGANTYCSKLGSFIAWVNSHLENHKLALEIESLELIKASRALRSINGYSPFSSPARTSTQSASTIGSIPSFSSASD